MIKNACIYLSGDDTVVHMQDYVDKPASKDFFLSLLRSIRGFST